MPFRLLSLLGLLATTGLSAQGSRTGLHDELCACMSAIPAQSEDALFTARVRQCLENAVVHHPSEVLDLLERYPEQRNKAYVLGLILGSTLEGRCAGFDLVKARLQQQQPRVPNDRKGT